MNTKDLVKERGEDYGHPKIDFARTALIWTGILGVKIKPSDIPLCMIGLKLSREVHKHKDDNIADIQGYAETLKMLYED